MRSSRLGLVLGAAWLLGLVTPAHGQEELLDLLGPQLGKLPIRSDYRITYFLDQPVANQPTELGLVQHDGTLSGPLWQSADDEWSASLRVRAQEFETRAVLPDTREPFPDELWNIRFGLSYRHRLESGWIGGGHVTVGSPSDQPFASADELDVNATAFLRVPRRERDAWLFFVNYSNTRDFLANFPVPGLGYLYRPSEEFSALIATGFASVQYRPMEKLTMTATYTLIRTVDVRVTYQITRPVRLWAGFDWTNERYLRADRQDADDRLFYYEKRVRVGATIGLAREFFTDVAVGYSFDRFYFEGEDYSDRHDNRVDVGSGPFAAVRVGARF
jgi:hypothetical protein